MVFLHTGVCRHHKKFQLKMQGEIEMNIEKQIEFDKVKEMWAELAIPMEQKNVLKIRHGVYRRQS